MNETARVNSNWIAFVTKAVTLVGMLAFASAAMATPDRVTVAWDPNPETDIAGYNVYYGELNSGKTNVVRVTSGTEQEIAGLAPQKTYWFFVTAENASGLESDPSVVLQHTTPANTPPTITFASDDKLVIAPATIRPVGIATDDFLAPDQLSATWTQISGPAVNMQNGNKLQPDIQISSAGNYRFRLTVSDGTYTAYDEFSLEAFTTSATPAPGSVAPNIQFMGSTFDGMIIAWDSAPGHTYHLAFKSDLNDPTWEIVGKAIPAMGSTTYWVDDRGYPTTAGFFGVFQAQ